ncbi:MAG: acetate--CoA ligase family protein, partial [Actinomycetota bacterium]|nr:acetate--CoA ligase family protein [Actinomycetota bacterium]
MTALRRMLEPRSVAVVGASARVGSFGYRLATEVLASNGPLDIHLVNPGGDGLNGRRLLRSLTDVPEPVDLVLLGVPDTAVASQLELAAGRGDAGAVVFGAAHGLGDTLRGIATGAGMALLGGGCMGFVNVQHGIRAIGYQERAQVPTGPVALVSHSGSAFSALLRTHRPLGFTLAVSSGQELVTSAAELVDHALDLEQTGVVALLLETLRDTERLRAALNRAEEADVPVVALTVGGSPTGRRLVDAHSGALAGDDAAWEALFKAHGVHRVCDLDELVNTLELFALGRRVARTEPGRRRGIATVHDSGAERALAADLAHELGVPYAEIGEPTRERVQAWLDPPLVADNPLDVWGRGADTERLFADCLRALADDPAVAAVAFGVDLVEEYDGDWSFPHATAAAHESTDKPVVVLSNLAAAVDAEQAGWLRARGIPVLEGTRGGLRALGHLLSRGERYDRPAAHPVDERRQRRWQDRLGRGRLDLAEALAMLADYGITTAPTVTAGSRVEAVTAAERLGLPVVVKTDERIDHRSDIAGVAIGLESVGRVARAYDDLAERLGPRVVVQPLVTAVAELALGVVRDPLLGPLVMVAAGGTTT